MKADQGKRLEGKGKEVKKAKERKERGENEGIKGRARGGRQLRHHEVSGSLALLL